MYAIFMTGGKQYKASPGDVLRIEKIGGEAGDEVKFGDVIAFSDESGSLKTGTPYLDATVNATIMGIGKRDKVITFKFKSKKDYRKKQGHRQPYTEVEIDNFTVEGKDFGEKPARPEPEVVEEPVEEKTEAVVEDAKAKKAKAKAPKAEAEKVVKEEAAEEEAAEEEPVEDEVGAVAEEEPVIEEPAEEEPTEEESVIEEPVVEELEAEAVEAAEAEEAVETEESETSEKASEPKADEPKADGAAKLTKADIMAKLDELGVTYLKSAKKEELHALLEENESK